MTRRLSSLMMLLTSFIPVFAQRHEQLWFDFQVDYPFRNQYLFETTASYQTVLTQENKWRNFSITPTFEYHLFTWADVLVNVPMVYTFQTENVNTFELDPSLGARIHITQNRRFNTRFVFKVEQRMFQELETKTWDSSNRIRLKGEIWICLNGPNLFTDKLWYTILDYEEFLVTDQQVDERYASRRRARLGLGYRANYKNRFELIYTRQSSRNEIEGESISNDNVIQLRYKMFLNPARPTQ